MEKENKKTFSVFISGQGYFAESVLRMCINNGFTISGVCCPLGDKYAGALAIREGVNIITSGGLNSETMPACDLGISAHSFDYIGKKTRYVPRLGWIGYHPSLLPRHRGRSSIEWAFRMGDSITGGTVFWLNSGIDRGDIAYQDWVFISPSKNGEFKRSARKLWREKLQPMGVELLKNAVLDISEGVIKRESQDPEFSTWEPSIKVNDIYKPDALMIPERCG